MKRKTCNLPYGEASFRRLFKLYKINASNRNLRFELSEDQFRHLTKQRCFYCDREPYKEFDDGKSYGPYIYNGVDRLNNEEGYIILNSVSCCYMCNSFKSDFELSEFMNQIDRIYHNLNFLRLRNETI
jgi:hypothetical protein